MLRKQFPNKEILRIINYVNATKPLSGGQPADILLLTGTNNAYSRGITAGVGAFAARHGRWNVTPMLLPVDPPDFTQYDGIICITDRWMSLIIESGVPAVMTSSVRIQSHLPMIVSDNAAIGRLAAEHLLQRRLPYYVGVGPGHIDMSVERLNGFEATIRAAGYPCIRQTEALGAHHSRTWQVDFKRSGHWLAKLPKPAGLFAITDELAHGLLRACRHLGIRVPDDVAVVGVNNDEILAALTQPPLTSVILNAPGIGELAAATLDRLMTGQAIAPSIIRLPPLGIEVRQSTDILAVDDPAAAAAFRYIYANAHRPLDVAEVCDAVAVSRRSLERRFKAEFGRTLLTEIRTAHVKRAQQLLLTTDQPMESISRLCGFRHPENFFAAFRRVTGTTPAAYRAARKPKITDDLLPGAIPV